MIFFVVLEDFVKVKCYNNKHKKIFDKFNKIVQCKIKNYIREKVTKDELYK